MSEKKYVVPEGMLKTAVESTEFISYDRGKQQETWSPGIVKGMLEAALRWQSENPPKPNAQQCMELRNLALAINRNYNATEPTGASCSAVVIDWVGRMYDAPEPEVPKEIKDLLWEGYKNDLTTTNQVASVEVWETNARKQHNKNVIEAYRRGKKVGSS